MTYKNWAIKFASKIIEDHYYYFYPINESYECTHCWTTIRSDEYLVNISDHKVETAHEPDYICPVIIAARFLKDNGIELPDWEFKGI